MQRIHQGSKICLPCIAWSNEYTVSGRKSILALAIGPKFSTAISTFGCCCVSLISLIFISSNPTCLCSSVFTNAAPLGLGAWADTCFYTNAAPPGLKRVLAYTRFADRTLRGYKPHHSQFRDISRYFVAASLQMPPLWGLGLGLIHVSTQMPPLRGSRGFWRIHGLWIEPCVVANRTYRTWGKHRITEIFFQLHQSAPTYTG